jgi:hypothetical protein
MTHTRIPDDRGDVGGERIFGDDGALSVGELLLLLLTFATALVIDELVPYITHINMKKTEIL